MYRNPKTVRDLKESISIKEIELKELRSQLSYEKRLVPVGYELIGSGCEVMEGALAYEPHHGSWYKTGNSVGQTLNEQGYVDGITCRGYMYANPIKTYNLLHPAITHIQGDLSDEGIELINKIVDKALKK